MLILIGFVIGVFMGWLSKFAFDFYAGFVEDKKKLAILKSEMEIEKYELITKRPKPM